MSVTRRKFAFNSKLQIKYPFLEKHDGENELYCRKCCSAFNIGIRGISRIERHLNSVKHKNATGTTSPRGNRSPVPTYITSAPDYSMAACEGVWAYHAVKETHSFRSGCAMKIFTTCEGIVTRVYAPLAIETLKTELERVRFVTLSANASNQGRIKMLPLLVQYFVPTTGVKVKLLELISEEGDTSENMANSIRNAASKFNVCDKVVGFCADFVDTNFAESEHVGTDDIFSKIKECWPSVLGLGSAALIVHNALKTSCDGMPVDIESVVTKICSHFQSYHIRVEALKSLFEELNSLEHGKLLSHSKMHFFALGRKIQTILNVFDALRAYFLGLPERKEQFIKTFFNNPLAKFWLLFIKDQVCYFHETVLKMERDNISAVDVSLLLIELRGNIANRRQEPHLLPATEIEKDRLVTFGFEEYLILDVVHDFYDDAYDYLEQWTEQFSQIESFSWIALRKYLDWCPVRTSVQWLSKINIFDMDKNFTKVFEQYNYIKEYCTTEKIDEWDDKAVSTEKRWTDIFSHMESNQVLFNEFASIVEFILCLPGSTVAADHVASLIHKSYTENRVPLQIKTLESILIVKFNFEYTCVEFYNFLKTHKNLLKKISSILNFKRDVNSAAEDENKAVINSNGI